MDFGKSSPQWQNILWPIQTQYSSLLSEFLPEFLTTGNWRNISRKAAVMHGTTGTHSRLRLEQKTQKSILTSLAFEKFSMSRPRFDRARKLSKNVKKFVVGTKFEEEYYPPKLCSYCIQITMLGAAGNFLWGEEGRNGSNTRINGIISEHPNVFVLSNNPILQILLVKCPFIGSHIHRFTDSQIHTFTLSRIRT